MNGYINYLSEKNDIEEIILVISNTSYNKNSVKHLYEGNNKIKFLLCNSDYDIKDIIYKKFNSVIEYNNKKYNLHNFGFLSEHRRDYKLPMYNWADSFYMREYIDPEIRYTYFKLPKNMDQSKIIYNNVINKINTNKYILIHDDPSRDRYLNYKCINDNIIQNGNTDIAIIYLGLNRYKYKLMDNKNNIDVSELLTTDSIFNYYDLIMNARECYFMDSSFACFTDVIIPKTKLLYLCSYNNDNNSITTAHKHFKMSFEI